MIQYVDEAVVLERLESHIRSSGSAQALAGELGLSPQHLSDVRRRRRPVTGALAETLTSYNEHAAAKEDPELHKHPDWLEPQDTGPWGAFDLSLGKAMYAGFTLGGMRVSLDGEARRADGSVIPGLYAVGACAANIAQDGKGYASGTQLAEGSYFGRRAGRHAAALAKAVTR